MLLVSSISAHSSPGQSPSMRLGVSVRPSRPERVGQPLGRVDGDDDRPAPGAGAPPARAPRRSSSCRRRPTRSTRRCGARATSSRSDGRSSTRRATLRRGRRSRPSSASASSSSSAGPSSAANRNGQAELGQRQLLGQPADLLGLQRRPVAAERGRRRAGRRPRRAQGRARRPRRPPAGSASSPASVGYRPLTTTGPEADADPVLEAEGGVDQLVDRRLLGQRDQHHLAPRRVGEQLEHVAGLGVDRARPAPRRAGRGPTAGT